MGAYLSEPITDKISTNDQTAKLKYGASSMQGWRVAQEDAHNCCPEFDVERDTALFAVYDGHGGSEVATYSAAYLPEFLLELPEYKEGKLAKALEEAFLGFDQHLTKEEVKKKLKEMAGIPSDDNREDTDDEEQPALLYEEATMPLEKLLEKYGGAVGSKIKALRKEDKFQSPVVKAKQDKVKDASDTAEDTVDSSKTENKQEIKSDPLKKSLENELINGVSENENNENKEKEQAQSAGSIDSSGSECNQEPVSTDTECSANSVKTNSDANGDAGSKDTADSTVQPDSSTDSTPAQAEASRSDACEAGGTSSSGEAVCSSSTGGSSSDAGAGSSADAGGSAGGSSACSSSAEAEAGSSSGRTRGKRVIGVPADDEDEDSMTDDSDSEEMDSSDEDLENLVEPDSEDDEDLEDEEMEEEEEEEEEDGIIGNEEHLQPGADSGTTAVVALLRGNDLHVANAGDSRCVLCRAGKAVDMSEDHKPEDEQEQERIHQAGGRVTPDGRVNGGLNLSRALGDHCYKRNDKLPLKDQMITPLPDVKSMVLDERDEFMVLACDGIWNVMSSQDVVNFVRERIQSGVDKLSSICDEMFDFCLAPDTTGDGTGCDNMTCIIVKFDFLKNDHQGASKRKNSEEMDTDSSDSKKPKSEET